MLDREQEVVIELLFHGERHHWSDVIHYVVIRTVPSVCHDTAVEGSSYRREERGS